MCVYDWEEEGEERERRGERRGGRGREEREGNKKERNEREEELSGCWVYVRVHHRGQSTTAPVMV